MRRKLMTMVIGLALMGFAGVAISGCAKSDEEKAADQVEDAAGEMKEKAEATTMPGG